jgi:membrane-bound lytic murein transglycosylase D
MSIYTLPPHALRRLACATAMCLSLPWMTGCAGLKDTLHISRRDGKAPVVAADLKPVARLVEARNASVSESLAIDDARPVNAPSVITRSLVPDDLKKSSASQADDEARQAAGAPTDPLRPDMTLNLDDRNANTDLWARVRRGFALPNLNSELVADHERWYASRPDYVQRMMERGNRYLYHVLAEVDRRDMPAELALLPFIESAFNPQAMSSARASGIWQFMPATGKDFELKQNLFRDDRRDVLASTRAALDYLSRLHRQFGDWHLALAAYNWGEGNVQRAINRNAKAGLPTDYLSLNMPPETRNYVPKLHAVRNIVLHPEVYGLALPPIENHPYFVSVPIQRDMDVSLAAGLAQMPLADFQALNPSMNKPVILAAGTPQILLPYNNASQFMHNLSQQRGPLASWTAWVVPKTMRPNEAARQVGMGESTLRELNHIPQRMLVKVGSTLLVPRSQHREQDVSESVADNAMMSLAPDLPPMRRMTLKAGKRDSVASIAKRYRVSATQVAQWNKVSSGASFKRAQTIVVYVPVKGVGRQLASATRKGPPPVSETHRQASNNSRIKVASASGSTIKTRSVARGVTRTRATPAMRQGKIRVASVSP